MRDLGLSIPALSLNLSGGVSPVALANFLQGTHSQNKAALDAVATFSRASNAMQFDSSGYLTYGPNNLLTQSNTFNNAAWSSLNGGTGTAPTVTSGQSDPLGGTSAFRVQAARGASNTTGDYSFIYNSFTSQTGVNYAGGMWIKSNTGSSQTVSIWLNTGAAVSSTAFVTATTSWQFLSPSVLNATGASNLLAIGTRGGTYGGQATVDVLVYAAVASAVTYETTPRTQDQVITTSAAYYGPRFDYTYNGSSWVPAGLLVEGAATNLALNSNNLAAATWTKASLALSTDGTLGPDGAAISKITTSSSVTTGQIYPGTPLTITSGSPSAQSWIVKKGNLNFVSLLLQVSAGNFAVAVFDISGTADISASQTAVGGTSGTVVSATGKYLGSGLYRLSLVATITGATAYPIIQYPSAATGNTFDTGGNLASMAAANSTSYAGYVQHELGSFASSYIPTASTVTRAAETVQLTGTALAAVQGVQGAVVYEGNGSRGTSVMVGSGGSQYRPYISGTSFSAYNGTTALSAAGSVPTSSVWRGGVAWSAAGRSITLNGGAVASDANGTGTFTNAYLGNNNGSLWVNTHIRSVAFYNQKIPDATLQAKSVVGASY